VYIVRPNGWDVLRRPCYINPQSGELYSWWRHEIIRHDERFQEDDDVLLWKSTFSTISFSVYHSPIPSLFFFKIPHTHTHPNTHTHTHTHTNTHTHLSLYIVDVSTFFSTDAVNLIQVHVHHDSWNEIVKVKFHIQKLIFYLMIDALPGKHILFCKIIIGIYGFFIKKKKNRQMVPASRQNGSNPIDRRRFIQTQFVVTDGYSSPQRSPPFQNYFISI